MGKSEDAPAGESVQKIKTACRACISNCSVIATVKDGRVVHIEGNPEDPMSKGHMCAKGLSGLQSLYNPNRNKYPMVRVGERGEGKWKRVSWDEALDLIADKLIEAKRDYGAESVFCSTGGGNPEFWSIARFCHIFGTPNWFEPGCAQCYLPRMCTCAMMYGGTDPSIADSNSHEIYFEDSKMKCIVLWGADPSYSSPAMGGAAMVALRARGVKTVVIDPRMTPDAAKATVWLPVRPGSDVALDAECEIDGVVYKTGFRLLKERVAEWTLEKAAETCWLDRDKIEEAIRVYAENSPAGICIGVATDQSANSAQAPQFTCILDGLMGNVEKPGNLLQRFGNTGAFKLGYLVPAAPTKISQEQFAKRLGNSSHKGLNFWMAGHPPTILQAIETGKPYPLRVWLERSGNKFVNVADGNRWEKAIKNVPFIVHMYMYPTSFSYYADVLLPTEEWLETDMIHECCHKLIIRQAATHLWETFDETLIWSMIAKRCAEKGDPECQKAFDEEYMGDDFKYWDSVPELLDHILAGVNTNWEDFKKVAPIEYMSEEEFRNYYAYLKTDPKTGKIAGFNTQSKKLELYLEGLITLGRTGMPFATYPMEQPAEKDYDPLPYYLEPYESPFGEMAKEYPLVMTNGRLPMFHHSTLRNSAYTREILPAPEVWIHPKAAEKYGIEDNIWVWVESERGRVRGVAHITTGINSGSVYMERYWNPENIAKDTHGWQEMNVSVLARFRPPYNDVFGTYTLRGYLVKVYPAPEGVWLNPREFKPFLATEAAASTPDPSKEAINE